jgi:hypothetical protein
MITQVDEMKKDRLFQSQPLLWIQNCVFSTETPRFWGMLPYMDYRIFSRHHFKFQLKNLGQNPAVQIAVSGIVYIKNSDFKLNSVSVRKEFLQSGEEISVDQLNSFHFSGDEKNELLRNLLLFKDSNIPYFDLNMIYKNILGGSFMVTETYALYLDQPESETVNDWLSKLAAFEIKHKLDFDRINEMYKSKPEEMMRNKEELKEEFLKLIPIAEIHIAFHPILNSLKIEIISSDKYDLMNNEMGGAGTPIALIKSPPCENR